MITPAARNAAPRPVNVKKRRAPEQAPESSRSSRALVEEAVRRRRDGVALLRGAVRRPERRLGAGDDRGAVRAELVSELLLRAQVGRVPGVCRNDEAVWQKLPGGERAVEPAAGRLRERRKGGWAGPVCRPRTWQAQVGRKERSMDVREFCAKSAVTFIRAAALYSSPWSFTRRSCMPFLCRVHWSGLEKETGSQDGADALFELNEITVTPFSPPSLDDLMMGTGRPPPMRRNGASRTRQTRMTTAVIGVTRGPCDAAGGLDPRMSYICVGRGSPISLLSVAAGATPRKSVSAPTQAAKPAPHQEDAKQDQARDRKASAGAESTFVQVSGGRTP